MTNFGNVFNFVEIGLTYDRRDGFGREIIDVPKMSGKECVFIFLIWFLRRSKGTKPRFVGPQLRYGLVCLSNIEGSVQACVKKTSECLLISVIAAQTVHSFLYSLTLGSVRNDVPVRNGKVRNIVDRSTFRVKSARGLNTPSSGLLCSRWVGYKDTSSGLYCWRSPMGAFHVEERSCIANVCGFFCWLLVHCECVWKH